MYPIYSRPIIAPIYGFDRSRSERHIIFQCVEETDAPDRAEEQDFCQQPATMTQVYGIYNGDQREMQERRGELQPTTIYMLP